MTKYHLNYNLFMTIPKWIQKLVFRLLQSLVVELKKNRSILQYEPVFFNSTTRAFKRLEIPIFETTSVYLGKILNNEILEEFKALGIDLCGEAGEYHTIVTNGPIFKKPLHLTHGKQVLRDGYWFSDISLKIACPP